MAWYRAGGGGIPAALKTGMNDVLNKKFGTSTTYAPNTWPDNVNLLGKLPEKTASGAIAHIEDGADRVPVKAWGVTISPNLDGVSSVGVVHCGKNILPNTAQTATENGVTYTVNSDGTVSLSGTCNADTNFYIYSGFSFPKLGQYFFSGCPSGGSTSTYRVFLTNYGADTGNGYSLNVTNLSTTTSIRINIKSGVVTDGLVFKPQIEAGNTATTYEPYVTPTTHTVNLGRTIYGGSVDVVTGTAEPTNLLDETAFETYSNWRTDIASSGSYPTGNANRGFELQVEAGVTYAVSFGMDSETYPTYLYLCRTNGVDSERLIYFSGANYSVNNGTFTAESGWTYYFRLGSTGTEANFNGQISKLTFEQVEKGSTETAYSPYFTPFTFTPITPPPETAMGFNNFWADEGDSQVTYRRDIDLALGGG